MKTGSNGTHPQLTANLRRHVDRLAGLIGPRHLGQPRALEAAAVLIERELTQLGYDVHRQPYPVRGCEVRNLVAELPGSDRRDQVVVLGAHYDTVESTPGADDNASAIAVLLEVARMLTGAQPRRTVRFVAFPCEEPPHFYTGEMGSQVYARQCRQRGERIVGMLCLEMVGYFSSAPGSQQVPVEIPRIFHRAFPRRGNFLASVANLRSWSLLWSFRRGFMRAVRFPLYSVALPEILNAIRLSDNSSFWDQGYPALMLTDTAFLRNPHYHLSTDTPETLDYEAMASVAIGVAGGVAQIAGAAMPSVGNPHLPIFVYGTLKRGEVRERCWPVAPLSVESATTRGRLFDLGPYPALIDGEERVAGELWHVAAQDLDETLRVLDEIECFGNQDVDLYVRRVVSCIAADGSKRKAYAYFLADPNQLADVSQVLPDADGLCQWRGHAKR